MLKLPHSNSRWAESVVAGVALLLFVSTLVGINLWLFTSEYGPLRDRDPWDFVIYLKPLHVLVAWNLVCLIGVVAGHLLLTAADDAANGWSARLGYARVAYLAPLCLFVLPPLTIGGAMFGFYGWMTPWLYVFVDLRWWFLAAVLTIEVAAISDRIDGAWRDRISQLIRQLTVEPLWRGRLAVALMMVLAAFAWASSPRWRFHSIIVGDEPKYLRFLENWYRGQGLDISHFPSINELPDDRPRLLDNVKHVGSAARTIALAVVEDIERVSGMAAGSSAEVEQRVEATAAGNWSVRGVHGGLYQGHHPGASLFLLPGYVLDRYLLNWTNIHQRDLPTYLYATNASLFVLFALWAVALYHMLAAHCGNQLLAFGIVAVVMMSLPATAFSYQYYAEAAGGFVITLVAYFAIFMTDARRFTAFTCGLLAGFLPLMHPRWGPAAAIVAATVLATRNRRTNTQLAWFFAGFLAMMATFILYTYYVTGSMLPWTMYEIDPTTPGFSATRALAGLPQLWLNWRWGLIAHAPVYLLALPGLVVFMRQRPLTALPTLAIVLATATLAAAHGWGGSGTTPGRLIAAVTPLLVLPMADACRAGGRSRWFVAIAVLLAAVSIDNGFFYNVFFERSDVALNAPSVSGWKTPLLLARPDEGGHVDAMLVAWTLITAALMAFPMWSGAFSERFRIPRPSWAAAVGFVSIAFATAGSAVGAYSGNLIGYRFLRPQDEVEQGLIRAHIDDPAGRAWSARHGRIDLDRLPNVIDGDVAFHANGSDDPRNVDFVVEVGGSVPEPKQPAAWGAARIDFGDGESVERLPVIGRATTRHRYAGGGRYMAALTFERPGTTAIRTTRVIMIPREPPHQPPGWAAGNALGVEVRDVLVEEQLVRVRCTIPADASGAHDARWWAWVGTSENSVRGGAVFGARLVNLREAGAQADVEFTMQPLPAIGERVIFSVGMTGTRSDGGALSTRSRAATITWPAVYLTRGGAVAATLTEPTSLGFPP